MDIKEITFLSNDQVFGGSKALELFKRYGTKCAITDFSILLGGYVEGNFYTSEGNSRNDRTGWWWTKSSDGDNDARVVSDTGNSYWNDVRKRSGGARPVLPYSSISSCLSNGVRGRNGILEVEY